MIFFVDYTSLEYHSVEFLIFRLLFLSSQGRSASQAFDSIEDTMQRAYSVIEVCLASQWYSARISLFFFISFHFRVYIPQLYSFVSSGLFFFRFFFCGSVVYVRHEKEIHQFIHLSTRPDQPIRDLPNLLNLLT